MNDFCKSNICKLSQIKELMPEMSNQKDNIEFVSPRIKDWRLMILVSFLSVMIFQGMIHLNPYNMDWLNDGTFRWGNFLQFILIDQILIEVITVLFIAKGIAWYYKALNLKKVELSKEGLFFFFLKFLPLFLLIYFCFAPFTTMLRFGIHHFPNYETSVYFEDYFFIKKSIYLVYLFPTFLIGYGFLVRGILIGRSIKIHSIDHINSDGKQDHKILLVKNQEGGKYISTKELAIIDRKDRKYWVKTKDGKKFITNLSLAALEEILPPHLFIRINRGTIIHLDMIETFSYWENQKYILKTKNGDEFTISRERMKFVKARILSAANDEKS